MEKRRETIDASVREHAAEKRRREGAHPKVEELAAYHDGELGEGAVERIRDHLALCAHCSNLVLDLAGFSELEPPSEAYRLSEDDVKARKAELLARLAEGERPSARLLEFAPRPEAAKGVERPAAIPVWYHALAAALLAATVGLSFWAFGPRQQISGGPASPPGPRLNTVVETLFPVGDNLRSSARPETVSASSNRDLVLLLTFVEDVNYADYRIEIYDGNGRLALASDGLERQPDGFFALTFPKELRGGGSYRLKVLGLGQGDPEALAEYDLDIDTP